MFSGRRDATKLEVQTDRSRLWAVFPFTTQSNQSPAKQTIKVTFYFMVGVKLIGRLTESYRLLVRYLVGWFTGRLDN
jgi:hypothetical protein